MTVDLPPPAVPSLAPVAQLQSAATAGQTRSFQGKRLHIAAESVLREGSIDDAIRDADSLEEVLAGLEVLYYRSGYPAARVHFARDGSDVFIVIRSGWISEVRDETGRYAGYFRDLRGRKPLRDTDLSPRLALATMQADRVGEGVALKLEPAADGGEILVIAPPIKLESAGKLRADINNFGSRYAGRYQGSVSGRYALSGGDQASISVGSGLRNIGGEQAEVGPYHMFSGGLSHVGRLGVLELSADYARAQARPQGLRLNQDIERWGASWSGPLYVSFYSQFNLQVRAERFRKSTRESTTQTLLQEQHYPAVTLAPAYAQMLPFENSHLSLKIGTEIQRGLGQASEDPAQAQLNYWLLRPAVAVQYFSGYWDYSLGMTGQLTTNRLPEQQQWVLGGPGNLYAYLPGAAIGDVGSLLSLKLHRVAFGYHGIGFEPSAFAEYGVSRLTRDGGVQGSERTAVLGDVGVKLSVILSRFFNLTFSATQEVYASDRDTLAVNAERGLLYFRATLEY